MKKTINLKAVLVKILLLLIICVFAGILLKSLLVKQKWFSILDINDSETMVVLESDSDLQIKLWSILPGDTLVNPEQSGRNEVGLYQKKFEYSLAKINPIDIKQVRFGINYTSGFSIEISGNRTIYSPNFLHDSISGRLIFLLEHPILDSEILEYFYFPGGLFQNDTAKVILTLLSKEKFETDFEPNIKIEVLRTGIFLSDFNKLRMGNRKDDFESQLPKIYINTDGEKIPDEPKIEASFLVKDSTFEMETNIRIETRGKSSQWNRQLTRSYGFKTYDTNWKKKDISLLNLPKESDWVLYSPYTDKSLLRNALAYTLSEKTGQYAPRYRFCNLFLNNKYQGIYMLIEKPILSKNRIKYQQKKNSFLCKIDRSELKDINWNLVDNENGHLSISISDPKRKNTSEEQVAILKQNIKEVQDAFHSNEINYKLLDSLVNINSLIDYIIISELCKSPDSYAFSTYFSKSFDEKLLMGPVWDYDIAFGNSESEQLAEPFHWSYVDSIDDINLRLKWPEIMLNDKEYRKSIADTWFKYRTSILSNEQIYNTIDSLSNIVSPSLEYHYQALPLKDRWVWPNSYVGSNYENEIFFLKCWIIKRLLWMDSELSKREA